MGYYTNYYCDLKITGDINLNVIKAIKKQLGNNTFSDENYYHELQLNEELDGFIMSEEGRKAYELETELKFFIEFLKPYNCRIEGKIKCQGEDFYDIYYWIIDNDEVLYKVIDLSNYIKCPHCGEEIEKTFII
jgi:uncharacterized SAM-dependent methyltransferase